MLPERSTPMPHSPRRSVGTTPLRGRVGGSSRVVPEARSFRPTARKPEIKPDPAAMEFLKRTSGRFWPRVARVVTARPNRKAGCGSTPARP